MFSKNAIRQEMPRIKDLKLSSELLVYLNNTDILSDIKSKILRAARLGSNSVVYYVLPEHILPLSRRTSHSSSTLYEQLLEYIKAYFRDVEIKHNVYYKQPECNELYDLELKFDWSL